MHETGGQQHYNHHYHYRRKADELNILTDEPGPQNDRPLESVQMLAPHTSPLFVSAFRLLPAGFVLMLWGSLNGREQPKSAMAWLSIAAFGFVDATCFQASRVNRIGILNC